MATTVIELCCRVRQVPALRIRLAAGEVGDAGLGPLVVRFDEAHCRNKNAQGIKSCPLR